MYTEEDLRATLDALENEAPWPGTVLAGLDRVRRRRVTRRRVVGMVAAAAVVAVVAAGSVVATNALTVAGRRRNDRGGRSRHVDQPGSAGR